MKNKDAIRRLLWGMVFGLAVFSLGNTFVWAGEFFGDNPTQEITLEDTAVSASEDTEEDEDLDWEEDEDEDDWEEDWDDVDFEDMDWDDEDWDEDWDEDDEELTEDTEFELEGIEESVAGKVYVFNKKNHYAFSESRKFYSTLTEDVSFGEFSIAGDFTNFSEIDGISAYEVGSGNVSFVYRYDDSRLRAEEDTWHLITDQSRQVDDTSLRSNIKKGAILVQMSKDRETWTNIYETTNLFEKVPITEGPFFTTTDVQVLNGNYVRVIVLYKMGVKKAEKAGSRRFAEVYEFYLSSEFTPKKGKKQYDFDSEKILANTGKGNGYSENRAIEEGDMHYGWSLGQFYVTGYTDVEEDEQGEITFMKKEDGKVCLWYALEQDINSLGGNEYLSVMDDDTGYDLFFNATSQHFGKGALIIGQTDVYGTRSDPQVTTNFLDSQADMFGPILLGAFSDEAEIEVALDYMIRDVSPQIKDVNILAKEACYQDYFKFSVFNE